MKKEQVCQLGCTICSHRNANSLSIHLATNFNNVTVHLGLNVSSSAHNCGCVVDGGNAMAAI